MGCKTWSLEISTRHLPLSTCDLGASALRKCELVPLLPKWGSSLVVRGESDSLPRLTLKALRTFAASTNKTAPDWHGDHHPMHPIQPSRTHHSQVQLELSGVPVALQPQLAPAGVNQSDIWRRLAQIGTGRALYAAFNWLFDNVLYVYVVMTLGMFKGGALMMGLSFLVSAVILVAYQRMRIDWVGAGLLAEIRRKPVRTRLENVLVWASSRHPGIVFILLCVLQDPFITAAYFKQGSFERLSRRDWGIFVAAVFVSNLYWIFAASLIGQAVVALWRLITLFWA